MTTLSNIKGIIHVWVKPGSASTEILSFDKEQKLLKISLNARPEHGKANTELVKFLKKKLKRQVRIKSGLNSKKKLVEIG